MSEPNNIPTDKSLNDKILSEILKNGRYGYCLYKPEMNKFTMPQPTLRMLGINETGKQIEFDIFKKSIFNKDDQKSLEEGISQLIKKDQSFIIDFKTIIESNGLRSAKVFNLKFSKITENELLGIFTDITDQRKAEKEIKRFRSILSKEENFKTVFLKNLSHEIRTPMNAILGFSELLGLPDISPETVKNYTSIIRDKGQYLLGFMDDVIELSKFESDNIAFNKSEFELIPLLNELFDEFDKRRIERGKDSIKLMLKIPKGMENLKIYTDPGRLQQILGNLLSNALKFTEKGTVEFGFLETARNYKFYVKDTGIGLSEEDQKKIFRRFEVLEDTRVKRLGGTGLSLTIAKRIVEKLGGKIKVSSHLGQGSRFQLNIPVESPGKNIHKDKPENNKENNILSGLKWADKVILIAESEELNYRFLEAVLQSTGAKILRAANGKEAIELCRNIAQIDLVVMEQKMTLPDGTDAVEILKKEKSDLTIIAQTVYSGKSESFEIENKGFDDYITKPIDISALLVKIDNLL
jgi:signal transduction histidine kinase